MKNRDLSNEQLKREVHEAHRKFFLKRGINPETVWSDFHFGSSKECPSCERPWSPANKKVCECGYKGRPINW